MLLCTCLHLCPVTHWCTSDGEIHLNFEAHLGFRHFLRKHYYFFYVIDSREQRSSLVPISHSASHRRSPTFTAWGWQRTYAAGLLLGVDSTFWSWFIFNCIIFVCPNAQSHIAWQRKQMKIPTSKLVVNTMHCYLHTGHFTPLLFNEFANKNSTLLEPISHQFSDGLHSWTPAEQWRTGHTDCALQLRTSIEWQEGGALVTIVVCHAEWKLRAHRWSCRCAHRGWSWSWLVTLAMVVIACVNKV